jgi:hypothetical protein
MMEASSSPLRAPKTMTPYLATFLSAIAVFSAHLVWAAPPIDYCPSRTPDQQIGAAMHPESKGGARAEPGCVPLVEKKDPRDRQDADDPGKPRRDLKIENLQGEVSRFLQRQRQFLECCKTDTAQLQTIEEMGDEVAELLETAQSGLFSEQMKLRGFTLREMILPVAKARQELRDLRKQLEGIDTAREKRRRLDSEGAGKESLTIQEAEDSIQRGFRPHQEPAGPKTGSEIGVSPSIGKEIGKTPTTGTAIGSEGVTGPNIGVNPKTGREIGTTGPTGFEIGGTGRAGPGIGESNFNRDSSAVGSSLPQSSVGSSLNDSTVGSSLGSSNIGSTLPDASVGSSLGGSSVGSSIQNRSTAP